MSIASFCRDQLENGPLSLDALTDRVVEAGLTQSRTPQSTVQSALSHREVRLPDGTYASPLWLLQGRWLTTRPFARFGDAGWNGEGVGEVADDANPTVDLAPLLYLLRGGPLEVEGGQVKARRYCGMWNTPKGWPGLAPRADQLMAFRVVGRKLEAKVMDESAELRMRGAGLSSVVGAQLERPRWVSYEPPNVTTVLWPMLLADPELLREPVPPFSSCIAIVADAIRDQRRRAYERDRFWQPTLVLPGSLRSKVEVAAHGSGVLLNEWLNAYVTEALNQLPDDEELASGSYFGWAGDR